VDGSRARREPLGEAALPLPPELAAVALSAGAPPGTTGASARAVLGPEAAGPAPEALRGADTEGTLGADTDGTLGADAEGTPGADTDGTLGGDTDGAETEGTDGADTDGTFGADTDGTDTFGSGESARALATALSATALATSTLRHRHCGPNAPPTVRCPSTPGTGMQGVGNAQPPLACSARSASR
jgi:hypothetical protein